MPSLAACRALGFNIQEENDNDGGYRNNPAKLTAVPTAPSTVPGPTGVAPPPSPLVEESAAEFIVRTVMAAPGEITLVPVGPLTNIAAMVEVARHSPVPIATGESRRLRFALRS